MDEVESTHRIDFHGEFFIVTIGIQNQENLYIEVEDENKMDRWGSQFSAKYIEEITKKTGNVKKFPVFVKMLYSALSQKSDTVFVDLLTFADLEKFRNHSNGNPNACHLPNVKSNKRYLIMTYAVEFDRVHYPLPLNFIIHPTVEMMQKTITRLKSELMRLKHGPFPRNNKEDHPELLHYQQENHQLLKKVQKLDEEYQKLQENHQSLIVDNNTRIAAYEQLHREKKKLEQLQQRNFMDEMNDDVRNALEEKDMEINELKNTLKKERLQSRKLLIQRREQLEEAVQELEKKEAQKEKLLEENKLLLSQHELLKRRKHLDSNLASTTNLGKKSLRSSSTKKSSSSNSKSRTRSPSPLRPKEVITTPTNTNANSSHSKVRSSSTGRNNCGGFKRFDPTAYHREQILKGRTRSQSPMTRMSKGRKTPTIGGYSSDSSMESSQSHSKVMPSSTCQRSSRLRTRAMLAARQRDLDARLASPRSITTPQNQSPNPNKTKKEHHLLLSPRNTAQQRQQLSRNSRHPSPMKKKETQSSKTLKKQQPQSLSHMEDELSSNESGDETFTEISHISKRLDSLQSFLRAAKTEGNSSEIQVIFK